MIEVSKENKKYCCGCSACSQTCPVQCITMKMDEEGFIYPEIDKEKCIGCNQCDAVCPILQKEKFYVEDEENVPRAIGGWHMDDEIRYDSSSGGAFSLFAIYIINQGGIVYGAAFDEHMKVKHIGVETIDELTKLRGSKYVQSNINSAYIEVKRHLQEGRKVLFVGTPCQTAGLDSFLRRKYDNLYIVDFICHGVPSPMVFESYLKHIEADTQDKIINFKFRMKDKPWNPLGMQMGTEIKLEKGVSIRKFPAYKDSYMNGFLDDVYLRPSCYDCKFKCIPKYYADITIADFWGIDRIDKELCDGKGTSLLLIHSDQGDKIFELTKGNFYYREYNFDDSVRRNQSLIKSVALNPHREIFFRDYRNKSFTWVMRKYMSAFSWASHKIAKIMWNVVRAIIKKGVGFGLSLLHIEWTEQKWESFFQFVKFSMVGVTNTMVSYLINISILYLLKKCDFVYDYMIANVSAFFLSVLWSYYWNSQMVFKLSKGKQRSKFHTLLKTYASYAFTGIFLNNVLATIWIQGLKVSKYLSPILNLPFSLPVNFFMNKYWAYREKKISEDRE